MSEENIKPAKKRGRPLKETTEISPPLSYMEKKIQSLKDLIVKTITDKGVKFSDAVRLVGLSIPTGTNYIKSDPDFLERVTRAEIKFKSELISEIKSQGKRDWRANAWLLQHLPTYRDEFSDQSKVQIETDKTQSSQIVVNLINQVIQSKGLENKPKEIETTTTKVNLLEDAEEEDNE